MDCQIVIALPQQLSELVVNLKIRWSTALFYPYGTDGLQLCFARMELNILNPDVRGFSPLRIQFKLLGGIVYSKCLGVSNRFSISMASFLRIQVVYQINRGFMLRLARARYPANLSQAGCLRLRLPSGCVWLEFNKGDQGAPIRVALNFPVLEGVALGSDGF